jgi:hypothetical protein
MLHVRGNSETRTGRMSLFSLTLFPTLLVVEHDRAARRSFCYLVDDDDDCGCDDDETSDK